MAQQQPIKNACHHLLRPVVRMLLRSGITWKDFAELSKGVFVEVAREDYGLRGRPTNSSRVALLTGLSRREVARVRDLADGLGVSPATVGSLITASYFTMLPVHQPAGWVTDATETTSPSSICPGRVTRAVMPGLMFSTMVS